jgi:DNA-binding MarR family transcriptional regulator
VTLKRNGIQAAASNSLDAGRLAELMVRVLPICHRLMIAAVHRTPHTRGMSLNQFRVLARLRERDYQPTQLASALEIGKSTLTISVNSLVRRGFVERREAPHDGRAVVLGITSAGQVLLRALEASAAGGLAQALSRLDDEEREALSVGFSGLERLLGTYPNISPGQSNTDAMVSNPLAARGQER